MARVDDYTAACKLALDRLQDLNPAELPQRSGFAGTSGGGLRIDFLDRTYALDPATGVFTDMNAPGKDIPLQEQVLILHYLISPQIPEPAGQWVTYREIPGATFYYAAFVKRAIDPLKNVFGANLEGFEKAAGKLGGQPVEPGDLGFEFRAFPKVPLQLILWAGDDEFAPEANILFDESIARILSPEDIAWLAGMVVYRLMALSR